MEIILASQSPRRKDFLEKMGVKFEVHPSQFDEIKPNNIAVEDTALYFACQKAEDIYAKTNGDRLIIGCDTIVVVDDKIYGKPKNDQEAFDMIKSYANKKHLVVSGLCVLINKGGKKIKYMHNEKTKVSVVDITDDDISKYIKTGEPFDKAGGYAIQGKFNVFIDKIDGNVSSVIGLPTSKLLEIFKKENIKYFNFD